MSRFAIVSMPLLAIGIAACGPSRDVQERLAELEMVSAQKDTLLAEKDSLLTEVSANAQLMSDISAEIAKVQGRVAVAVAGAAEAPPSRLAKQEMLTQVRQLTARIAESEEKLQASEKRIASMNRESGELKNAVASMQRTVTEFQSVISNQKTTIASLMEQVSALQTENTRLATRTAELTDTVSAMTARDNTVYYIIGTKDELVRRGIVTEEGGSRVLFVFGKRGKTIVPARDLDPAQFTAIDQREVTEIPLPEADHDYRIASRQDLTGLATPPGEDGKIRGTITIADPERFWENNRFLIIVRT
jgi:regulator of replication initiation timing